MGRLRDRGTVSASGEEEEADRGTTRASPLGRHAQPEGGASGTGALGSAAEGVFNDQGRQLIDAERNEQPSRLLRRDP